MPQHANSTSFKKEQKLTEEQKARSRATRLERYGQYNSPRGRAIASEICKTRNKTEKQAELVSQKLTGRKKDEVWLGKIMQTKLEKYGSTNGLIGRKRGPYKKSEKSRRTSPEIRTARIAGHKKWVNEHPEWRAKMAKNCSAMSTKYWQEHPEEKERLSRINKTTDIEELGIESLIARDEQYVPHKRLESFVNSDQTLVNHKVAIFEDGCYWHGCPHCHPGNYVIKPSHQTAEEVRLRDWEVNYYLESRGWLVIRVWQHELKRDRDAVGKKLDVYLNTLKECKRIKEQIAGMN